MRASYHTNCNLQQHTSNEIHIPHEQRRESCSRINEIPCTISSRTHLSPKIKKYLVKSRTFPAPPEALFSANKLSETNNLNEREQHLCKDPCTHVVHMWVCSLFNCPESQELLPLSLDTITAAAAAAAAGVCCCCCCSCVLMVLLGCGQPWCVTSSAPPAHLLASGLL